MSRPGARALLSLLMLCIPLQGFGVALTRLAGTAHFHAAVAADHDHDHDGAHQHHGTIEHHHHDADDDSVVVVDETPFVSGLKAVIASIRALDVEPMASLGADAPLARATNAPPDEQAAAFDSQVVAVLDRPPR